MSSLAGTIPESVYMFFQMTFAIITPALIAGALADRMKFSAFLWFMGLWLLFVYCPIAHWVWGGGWLGTMGALDYAGGSVVHLNAGTAALVTCLVLGKRIGLGTENMSPHNLVLVGHRRLAAVGRLVRLQRRLRRHRRLQCRHGRGRDANRDRCRRAGLDVRRMDHRQEAFRSGHDLRRRRRPGGDHPGFGLCRSGGRAHHRHRRRRGLLHLGGLGEEGHRL